MKTKARFILPLLLIPFMGLTSCGTSTSESTSSNTSSTDETQTLNSVTYYLDTTYTGNNKEAPSNMSLTHLWTWNASPAGLLKNAVGEDTEEVAGKIFRKFTLAVGQKFTDVCTDWGCKETIEEVEITADYLKNMSFLVRDDSGNKQTGDFTFVSGLVGDATVYYLNNNGTLETYLNSSELPQPLAVPEALKSIDFYYFRNKMEDYDTMNTLYLFSYGGDKVATIKPNWQTVDFNDKLGHTISLMKTTITIDSVYTGTNSWNFSTTGSVKVTREMLTGGVLVRSEDGVYRTSDLLFDYDKVTLDSDNKATVIYIDRDQYKWNANDNKTYILGDFYYSTTELAEALQGMGK